MRRSRASSASSGSSTPGRSAAAVPCSASDRRDHAGARRRPDVICFDEPTSSLGDEEVDILFALIRRLRDEGMAIGYVSHRMEEIFQLADRITVLRDGGLSAPSWPRETDHASSSA